MPAPVTDAAHAACLDFFRQDLATKTEAAWKIGPPAVQSGYRGPDTQRINPDEGVDVRETFSYEYDPRYALLAGEDLEDLPQRVRDRLREGDFPWDATTNLPQFKEAIVAYLRAMTTLARALTRSFALSLGLEEDYFDAKTRYPDASFGLNYYPPIRKPEPTLDNTNDDDPLSESRVSIGSHTDFQFFTTLWQDSVGGLQALNPEGQWINVPPVEGTYVVNVADLMQRISNDKYVSPVHRARNGSERERVSMAFFWGYEVGEKYGVVVGDGERKYEEVEGTEWLAKRIKDMMTLDEEKRKEDEEKERRLGSNGVVVM